MANDTSRTPVAGVRRRTMLKGTGVAGVSMLAGCLGGDDDGITIGALQPLSGNFAAWGAAHEAGLEFAVDEVNEEGFLDEEVTVESTDTESDAGDAATAFRRFVEEDGAVGITGPVSSDVGVRTAQIAEELETPMVLHMAGTHQLHTTQSQYSFRLGSLPAPMDLQPQADLIEERGYETIGAIVADYEWGRTVEDQIEELFPAGIDLTVEVTPLGESEFTPYLRDMPDDLDLLVATGHPPGSISIHAQSREIGLEHELTTGAGLPPNVIYEALGEHAETFAHLHVTDVYGDAFADVASRFADERGEQMSTHEGYGYIAGRVFAEAIDTADSTDSTEIAAAIRDIEYETILANPLRYNDWGEIDDVSAFFSTLHEGGPEYFPDGDFHLEEEYQSDPMSADLVEPLVDDER
ncbi:ABC transporter substrate-binding protein [Halovivax gelatinilyticus]|uniref:ABC transporter substrate-binding protein n=1 Tax=Halovivax gelatinilyticus TaxID=2961597 RepID=UPI0020CA5B20|nr:ABC transporter substrate-binding protein [Halovivax gelatinilyticus]